MGSFLSLKRTENRQGSQLPGPPSLPVLTGRLSYRQRSDGFGDSLYFPLGVGEESVPAFFENASKGSASLAATN